MNAKELLYKKIFNNNYYCTKVMVGLMFLHTFFILIIFIIIIIIIYHYIFIIITII